LAKREGGKVAKYHNRPDGKGIRVNRKRFAFIRVSSLREGEMRGRDWEKESCFSLGTKRN